MRLDNSTSAAEFQTCLIVWLSAVFYSIYCFGRQTHEYFRHYKDGYSDFSEGWSWLSSRKDRADYEWQTILFLMQKLYLWIIAHIVISEVFRKCCLRKALQMWQISITLLFVLKELGLYLFGSMLAQPLLFIAISTYCKSKWLIWCCNGAILLLLLAFKNLLADEEFMQYFKISGRECFITVIMIFWLNLKCLSFVLDVQNENKVINLLDFLSYCFYLPTFCGPYLSYGQFKSIHVYSADLNKRLIWLIVDLCRFSFWAIFAEFVLHFIYVNAVGYHPEFIQTLDIWSLYGYGYTMGQFFHIKYIVLYGMSITFAKFENIKTPSLPVCIGRVHLYSDMWRFFDAGLYHFLIRYIYVPSIKSTVFSNKLFSSLLCFTFIYIWHGVEKCILIWTVLNYIGIIVENLAKTAYRMHLNKVLKIFGPHWTRRLNCMAASPLLAFSAISNFYFLARIDVADIFLSRFLNGPLQTNLVLLAVLYTSCQVSTELRLKKMKKCDSENIKIYKK